MERLSEGKRILYTFTKPKQAMLNVGTHTGFAVPIVSLIVFPLLQVILNISFYQNQFYTLMQAQMLAMDLAIDVSSMVQMQLYITMGSAPVMSLLTWLVFSLAVYLLSMLFEGESEIGLKNILSITGYAFLIKAVYYVFSTVNMMVMPDTIVTYSLADLLGGSISNLYLISLLQVLSVFRIWEYAVIALGLSACKGISKGKAFTVMGLILAIFYATQCISLIMASSMLGTIA